MNVVLIVAIGLAAYLFLASNASAAPAETVADRMRRLGMDPNTGQPLQQNRTQAVLGASLATAGTIASILTGGGTAAASGAAGGAGSGSAGAAGGIGAGGAAIVGGIAAAFGIQLFHVLTSPSPEDTRRKLNSTSYGAFIMQFDDYQITDPKLQEWQASGVWDGMPGKLDLAQRLIDSGVPIGVTGATFTSMPVGTPFLATDGSVTYNPLDAAGNRLTPFTIGGFFYYYDRGWNAFIGQKGTADFVNAQQIIIRQVQAGQIIVPEDREREIFRTRGAFGF